LTVGQVSPSSYINVSAPCIARHLGIPNYGAEIQASYINVSTLADATAISNCTNFTGAILIDSSFPGDLVLPKLQVVDGLVIVGSGTVPGGDIVVPSNLTGVIFPQLSTVASAGSIPTGIEVGTMANLTTIWFPQLYSVAGAIYIHSLPALTDLSDFHFSTNTFVADSGVSVIGTNITSLTLFSNFFYALVGPYRWNGSSVPYGNIQVTDNPNLITLDLFLEAVTYNLNVSAQNITTISFQLEVILSYPAARILGVEDSTVWEIIFCQSVMLRAVFMFTIRN
jgi:hypothetical protein